jgi:RNA polymerase sigma factor (sigma-70 family)
VVTDIDVSPARDATLHAAWRTGDPRAAAELIVRYRPRLCAFGERLGLTPAQAEDLAQEVLLDAPSAEFEPRPGASYWSWLACIARRKAARMREKARLGLAPRRHTTPWSGECRRRLLESIESMVPNQRDVFAQIVRGCDVEEIAEDLGVEPGAIYMRIHRGRKWLRARGY